MRRPAHAGLLLLLAGCPAPGEGRKAEQARAALDPVLGALRNFHRAEHRYPAALEELVPRFLVQLPPSESEQSIHYGYHPVAPDDFQLEFRYGGPGMNVCDATAEKTWSCYGYY